MHFILVTKRLFKHSLRIPAFSDILFSENQQITKEVGAMTLTVPCLFGLESLVAD